MSGIELITELRRHRPETRVLVLSSYGDPGYVRAALEAGAAGYMLKTASDEELISAVRAAVLGATIVDAAVSADLFSANARSPQALTQREREIVGLVTKGLPNKAIAHSLTVSKRTVDSNRTRSRSGSTMTASASTSSGRTRKLIRSTWGW